MNRDPTRKMHHTCSIDAELVNFDECHIECIIDDIY